jgi:hypothetical protein
MNLKVILGFTGKAVQQNFEVRRKVRVCAVSVVHWCSLVQRDFNLFLY